MLQGMLGWGDVEVRNLGPAPVDPTETGEPPVLTEATLEVDVLDLDMSGAPFSSDVRTIAAGPRAPFEVPA
ncbi:hypothetical protein [Methylobacterium gregans]|uniref:hypothetical protein n=1 Tax=Methylobacterium gregans TaxID=374424 RepID=UPI00360CE22D